jgi:hypothetical protein
MKLEPELSNQAILTCDPLVQQDLSAIPYNTNVGIVVPPDMAQQVMAATVSINQYDLAPTDQPLDDPVPQGVLPAAWADVSLMDQEASFDVLLPNQRGGKRGPFKDLSLREQTAQTRKIGSCIRCRMQRIRVSNP